MAGRVPPTTVSPAEAAAEQQRAEALQRQQLQQVQKLSATNVLGALRAAPPAHSGPATAQDLPPL